MNRLLYKAILESDSNSEPLKFLLENKESYDLDNTFLNIIPNGHDTPLIVACYFHKLEAVKLLLKFDANPNKGDTFYFNPLKALFLKPCIDDNTLKIIDLLVKNGADVNKVDLSGDTLLSYVYTNKTILEHLKIYNIDLDLQNCFGEYAMPRNCLINNM